MDTIYSEEYIQQLEATNKKLLADNSILLENQKKLEESREKWKQKAIELAEDVKNIGTFLYFMLKLMRIIQPLNKQFKDFSTKYELDKIDLSSDEDKDKKEKKKDGKISISYWATTNFLSVPSIIKDFKLLLKSTEPILKDKEILEDAKTIFPAFATLYKYIENALNDEEKAFILPYLEKNAKALNQENPKENTSHD